MEDSCILDFSILSDAAKNPGLSNTRYLGLYFILGTFMTIYNYIKSKFYRLDLLNEKKVE